VEKDGNRWHGISCPHFNNRQGCFKNCIVFTKVYKGRIEEIPLTLVIVTVMPLAENAGLARPNGKTNNCPDPDETPPVEHLIGLTHVSLHLTRMLT
jgi:hypothetical protein